VELLEELLYQIKESGVELVKRKEIKYLYQTDTDYEQKQERERERAGDRERESFAREGTRLNKKCDGSEEDQEINE
jgi:hypothetical protein